jgi:hypothetical protein
VLLSDRGSAPNIGHLFNTDTDDDQFNRLRQQLHQFPNLSHLKIWRSTFDGLESFDSVINDCQRLESLDIEICPADDSSDEDNDEIVSINDIPLIIKVHPSIKRISGYTVIYSDQTLIYNQKVY